MKAARYHGKEDVRVEDVPEPSPAPGEVKIANAYSGICGSDLHLYYHPEALGMDFTKPQPLTGATTPQILGHEFSGTIAEVSAGVEGFEVGKVAVWPIYYCGKCPACENGAVQRVPHDRLSRADVPRWGHGGVHHRPGREAAQLPDNVDLRLRALVEPMAVAWHAVRQSGIKAGQTALIAGAGPVGIGVVVRAEWARGQHGRGLGAQPGTREAQGRRSGRRHRSHQRGSAGVVSEATGGRGVDAAFDAAGAGPALLSTLADLTPSERTVILGIHGAQVSINPLQMLMAETAIVGAWPTCRRTSTR